MVLPFADYFYTDDIRTGLVRNSIVMEYLVDRLVAKGVDVPVQEDVFQYLKDKEIVALLPPDQDRGRSNTESLAWELTGDWSGPMKDEIKRVIALEAGRTLNDDKAKLLNAPGIYSLDTRNIQELGDRDVRHGDFACTAAGARVHGAGLGHALIKIVDIDPVLISVFGRFTFYITQSEKHVKGSLGTGRCRQQADDRNETGISS